MKLHAPFSPGSEEEWLLPDFYDEVVTLQKVSRTAYPEPLNAGRGQKYRFGNTRGPELLDVLSHSMKSGSEETGPQDTPNIYVRFINE